MLRVAQQEGAHPNITFQKSMQWELRSIAVIFASASVNLSTSLDAGLCFGLLIISLFHQVEIHHASEVDEIFDAISYDKGASVIRMLQNYLGAERFQVLTGSP
jgi:aminopeptidase N